MRLCIALDQLVYSACIPIYLICLMAVVPPRKPIRCACARERLSTRSLCFTSTDSAITDRAPSGPNKRAIVARRCTNSRARSRITGHRNQTVMYDKTWKSLIFVQRIVIRTPHAREVAALERQKGDIVPPSSAASLSRIVSHQIPLDNPVPASRENALVAVERVQVGIDMEFRFGRSQHRSCLRPHVPVPAPERSRRSHIAAQ